MDSIYLKYIIIGVINSIKFEANFNIQILLQDWEDYALSPELLQPLTEPPLTTTTIKNQDGRDGNGISL